MTVISGFLKKGSFEVRRMWMHAFEVAAMSSMLCRKVPVTSEGVCFLAGLMHDIGRIVFLTLYNQVYIDIVDSPQLLEREKNAFGLDHSEVSSLFLEYSNFPREIIRAVRYHHNITEVKKDKGIATTVYLAEGLSDFITPIVEGDGVWGDTEMQVFREVGLSEIDLLTIQDDMTKEGPAIEAFFNLY
jgi:putative nucleotidyltransferase with HDIG domain